MSLVVLDDCHVVLNVREDYMHYFRMNETFRGNVPALKVENIEFKIYYISPLGSFATWRSTKQTGSASATGGWLKAGYVRTCEFE